MDEEHPPVTRPTETAKGRMPANQRGDVSWKSYSDQWNANHGTLLMCFAAGVFLVGVAVLAYQQNRFREPSFPSADAIEQATQAEATVLSTQPEFVLRVVGAADSAGEIRVAIYADEEDFNVPEAADWKQSLVVAPNGISEFRIALSELPAEFAIAAYHDMNSNGKLDRNALGIPTERYGFSNAARGTVGPPSFENAAIALPEADSVIELKIW